MDIISDKPQIELKKIQRINKHDSFITSIALLSDGRLCSSSHDNSIFIYNSNTYEADIYIRNIHSLNMIVGVSFVCEIAPNIILSCGKKLSEKKSIFVWKIEGKNVELIKQIDGGDYVDKIISLSKEEYAVCNYQGEIRIFSIENDFQLISALQIEDKELNSLIKIKNKEILLTACGETSTIWKFNYLSKEDKLISLKDISISSVCQMTELKNDLIAIGGQGNISIIDYEKMQRIHLISFENESNDYWVDSIMYMDELIFCGIGSFSTKKGYIYIIEYNDKNEKILYKQQVHEGRITSLCSLNKDNMFACGCRDVAIFQYIKNDN